MRLRSPSKNNSPKILSCLRQLWLAGFIIFIILFSLCNTQVFARVFIMEYPGGGGGGGGGGDSTPPTTPLVIDDGDYTNSTSQLHAEWSSQDPESGIAEYKYAIGTDIGATDVVDWTSAGLNTEITQTGLSLTSGQIYYFTVQAKNSRGLWSEPGSSDGIIADDSAPIITEVIDEGETTYNRTQLQASWQATDAEGTPIIEYLYAIGTSSGENGNDIVDWTSVGEDTQVTAGGLSLAVGQIYYFNVKAKNAAQLWSQVGSSDGITVVNRPPQITSLIPLNNSTFIEQDVVDIEVQAQDPDADALEYQYLVDDEIICDWSPENTYSWQTQAGEVRQKTITVKVKDTYDAIAFSDTNVFLYRKVPEPE